MKPVPEAKKTSYQSHLNQIHHQRQAITHKGQRTNKLAVDAESQDLEDKPPKVVGDNLYSSESDSDSGKGKRSGKRDSRSEGSEDEESSESDLEDSDAASDADSWHSEDSDKVLESDEEAPAVFPQFNEKTKFGELKFEVSMVFKSKSEFMQATRDYTIQWGRNILFSKNDKVRVRAVCKSEDCPWVVYCACNKQDGSWQIRTLVDNHTCPRRRKNRAATQTWTLSKLVPKLRKHPTMKHREVYDWFVRKCNVYLNSTCITRALKAARKIVEGDEIAQYGLVWDYANELLTSNPGSTVQVSRGFKAGCRPLIGLDGAFLKTLHGGQILTACGQDANNHILVIAYAIVSVENKDNWKWFIELLYNDLGDYRENKWCFISDMQKGLIPAVQEVFPRWSSTELKDMVWECARSRTTVEFNRNMNRVKLINQKAWEYLEKWPKDAWTKAHFSELPKVDNICNNACESFNAKIKHDRGKPILTLAEEVRRIIMKSIVDNWKKLENYQGILPPVQQSRLEAMTALSSHWAPQWSGDEKEELYEVHGWPTNMVVDLGKHTCSCRFWQLTAIQDKNDKRAEDYCHDWLKMEAYRKTYCFNVNPVKGQDLWEKTPHPAPVPPPFKAKPGRPTKKRRRDKEEQHTGSKTKMKRKYNPIRCMYCSEIGHNKRSCAKKKATEAEEHARQLQLQLALVAPAAEGAAPEATTVPAEPNPAAAPTQTPTVIDVSQCDSIPPTQETQQVISHM
ncbi:uncharacterized protein LOC107633047 [Arachis ipaensis]|uniref:uncharacterized protein LOC107633047 n=1 Tax=Arachis ipaensis TaxID=130454 RepID=UPI0007AEEA19|nr:uncharacterized protein LOC107633047 [Arachis ipaensis]